MGGANDWTHLSRPVGGRISEPPGHHVPAPSLCGTPKPQRVESRVTATLTHPPGLRPTEAAARPTLAAERRGAWAPP